MPRLYRCMPQTHKKVKLNWHINSPDYFLQLYCKCRSISTGGPATRIIVSSSSISHISGRSPKFHTRSPIISASVVTGDSQNVCTKSYPMWWMISLIRSRFSVYSSGSSPNGYFMSNDRAYWLDDSPKNPQQSMYNYHWII